MEKEYDLRFQAPFTMQVVGGTSSGKSFWTKRLLENASQMIHPPVDKTIYCLNNWRYSNMQMRLYFHIRDIAINRPNHIQEEKYILQLSQNEFNLLGL